MVNARIPSARFVHAHVVLTAGAAAIVLAAPSALADPPNCTAADLAGVAAGVSAATAAYLYTHPDLNQFVTDLKGQPRDQIANLVGQYLDARPQMRDEIRGIRKPLADIRARCGLESPEPGGDMPITR